MKPNYSINNRSTNLVFIQEAPVTGFTAVIPTRKKPAQMN